MMATNNSLSIRLFFPVSLMQELASECFFAFVTRGNRCNNRTTLKDQRPQHCVASAIISIDTINTIVYGTTAINGSVIFHVAHACSKE
jgi:hypothetical protein